MTYDLSKKPYLPLVVTYPPIRLFQTLSDILGQSSTLSEPFKLSQRLSDTRLTDSDPLGYSDILRQS